MSDQAVGLALIALDQLCLRNRRPYDKFMKSGSVRRMCSLTLLAAACDEEWCEHHSGEGKPPKHPHWDERCGSGTEPESDDEGDEHPADGESTTSAAPEGTTAEEPTTSSTSGGEGSTSGGDGSTSGGDESTSGGDGSTSGGDESTSGGGDGEESLCYDGLDLTSPQARVSIAPDGWGLGTGDFSMEFWIRPHHAFTAARKRIFQMNEGYGAHNIQTWLTDDNRVVCNTYHDYCPCGPQSGTGNALVHSAPIDDGQWHHVACVRHGSQLTVYTDGVPGETDYVVVNLQVNSNVSIGRQGGYAESDAAPVSLGPLRFSSIARYSGTFAPERDWEIDTHTVSQFLTHTIFDGFTLIDEAGGNNTGWHDRDVEAAISCE